jgi:predicted phage-related endonuclease
MIERHVIADRVAWLMLRSRDLTASDLGAAIGVDRFKSPLALYAEKQGIIGTADNAAMQRGRWMEPAVIEAIREEHPDWEVRKANVYLRDPELRLGCTADAVAITDRPGLTNIQLKVVAKPVFESQWSDGPPMSYQLQTLCEGMLMDAERSILAALVVDTYTASLRLFPVDRHVGAEGRLRGIAAAFWRNMASGRRPRADVTRDAETVAAMFPVSEPEQVLDLSADNRLGWLLPKRISLIAERDVLQAAIDEIETEVKDKMGAAERALLPGWRLSWPTQTRKAHAVRESRFRRLTITEKQQEE